MKGEERRAPSPSVSSYAATPSQGSGLGGGCGSPPSAVKISIGVADGDAPLSLLRWKDPVFPRLGKTATAANKMTTQSMNNTFTLDMRPPSVKEKAGRLGSGCPPQSCA